MSNSMRSFRMGYGLGGILQRLLNVSGNFGAQNTLQGGGSQASGARPGVRPSPNVVNPVTYIGSPTENSLPYSLSGIPAAMPVDAPEQLGNANSKFRRAFNYGYGQDHDFGRRNLDALTYTQGTTTPTLEQLLGRDSMMGDQFTIQNLIDQAEMDRQSRFNDNSMMYTPTPFTFTPPTPPPAPAPRVVPAPVPLPRSSMDRRDGGSHSEGGPNSSDRGPSGCFVEGTPIQMTDGTTKEITTIKIGEKTKGGTVEAKMEFMPQNIYNYKDVLVSGSHWVIEDNQFVAVEDSKHGVLTDRVEPVYTFKTSNNRIWVNDIEFGDFETGSDADWEPHFEAVRQKLNEELKHAR